MALETFRNMKKLLWSVLLIPFVLTSCGTKKDSGHDTAGPDFLASNIDSTIKPGDDFFLFANNGWFKKNPIPASEQSNGLWQLIRDTINAQVRQICESSAALKDAPKGSPKQKIGDMFFSGMDSINNNKLGLTALQPELDQIAAINDKATLAKAVAKIHMVSGAPLFNFYVGQDDKQSDKYAIFISQGGLSLPDRTYYVDSDDRALKIREKFPVHLKNMFQLMGNDEKKASGSSSSFINLETTLAKASRKREDTRDPLENYHKMPVAELQQMTPAFDWNTFFTECGLQDVDTVIVGQPEVLKALNTMLEKTSMDVWKDYLRYHLVRGLASYLDDNTYKETFNFFSTTLRGVTEPKPRWKRVTDQTNSALGELIGQVYVDEYLPKGTKEKLTEIGSAIKDVYADRIKNLDWMSDVTKEKALVKLSTIVMKVGYPDKWKDMSSLTVDRSSYARNVMNANEWAMRYMVNKFGNPVRRDEWEMYPQTYNAYYNPSNNEIVVPGCNIIVPGYERVLADDAILYSIIGGSTFGHEITHGFDDQGSKYDEKGNLNNWWTSEDSARFYAKTAMIVQQYGEYNPVDSLRINGELTQGENIADLGGIIMGYEAFKKTKQYIDKQVIAGLTPDQRFFLGYALAWMINERPESLAAQVKSDEHSPAKYRVIGPLSNMPEFYETFNIKEGDFMRRADSLRVKIW
ncbi:MAG: Neutral endopeptidase [Bacteroidetes bacterium ADurb.Bin397]|nr:MAG: Neutral endopeptidase [Bacteroidetes bacterium ADurb.Bin397]